MRGAMPIMTSSPAFISRFRAVGTTALARSPLPTMQEKAKLLAPALRQAYSPSAATSNSIVPGAIFRFMASYAR
jgi:hypothetical protein